MPPFPILAQPMLVICLEPGQLSPEGASWIELGPVIGEGWVMDGNIGIPFGTHAYRKPRLAIDDIIKSAMSEGISELWIEIDARRCR